MNVKIKGVIVPIITPFDAQGQLDTAAINRLVNYLIERGVHGLFPGGTTGECPLLSLAERRLLAETVIEAADGRLPVIIHTGTVTTTDTIELTKHAQHIGAHSAAVIPPYYFHYTQEALFNHYAAVAAAVPDFPIYLYNNPGVGNNNRLTLALVSQLVDEFPNIVGMKDSSGSLELLTQLSYRQNGAFNTASGGDGQILMSAAAGIDACVSGNANVVPELVVALHRAASEGDISLARKLQKQMDSVRQLLDDGHDLSLFKAGLTRRGLPVGQVRAPLCQISEAVFEQRWQALNLLQIEMVPI
ncbi:MAG: 4-hydroxy-tetrahydrodipicolinate synthase [Anaerolineae bacterium]|nr:4-hydroxy-tetrahydrodipicolinate synthase [Anaerolineae bacterium]